MLGSCTEVDWKMAWAPAARAMVVSIWRRRRSSCHGVVVEWVIAEELATHAEQVGCRVAEQVKGGWLWHMVGCSVVIGCRGCGRGGWQP